MDGKSWMEMLDRWLQTADAATIRPSIGVREVPPGTRLLEPKRGAIGAEQPGIILVAMIPKTEPPQSSERVHRRHYLVAESECCLLVGDDGIHFIPWDTIAWIRT